MQRPRVGRKSLLVVAVSDNEDAVELAQTMIYSIKINERSQDAVTRNVSYKASSNLVLLSNKYFQYYCS